MWGGDGDKCWYFLIEGNDDIFFCVYRESNLVGVYWIWWSVVGSIEEF